MINKITAVTLIVYSRYISYLNTYLCQTMIGTGTFKLNQKVLSQIHIYRYKIKIYI